jgi:hypothetical protein
MRKIQKVIDSCYDCEFKHVFTGINSSSAKAHICRHVKIIDEDETEHSEPFLLDVCDNGSNELPIPPNCPLEDYKEN